MTQLRCFGLAALATAALITPAFAGNPAQDGYRLRVKETQGAKYAYNVSFTTAIDMSGIEMPAGAEASSLKGEQTLAAYGRMDVLVQKVEKGKVTLKRTAKFTKVKGTGILESSGKAMAKDQGKAVTVVLDEMGHRLSGSAPVGSSPFDYAEVPFPVAPAYPGQKWTIPPVKGSGQEKPTTLALFGVELLNGKEALRFELSGIDLGGLSCKGPFVVYVDPVSGRTERLDGFLSGVQMGAKIRVHIAMDLIH